MKYGRKQLESMLGEKRSAHQPYSWLQIANEWIIVMWDTGCSLPGLIAIETVGKWIAAAPQALQHHHHTYALPRPINGIGADRPVSMVGVVVFRCEHQGRAIDLEFGVLKGGDTGAACAIIGNCALGKDKYGGLVDVGAGKAVLRNVDQRGDLVISITSEPARLSAMLALETEQGPEGKEDEGEGEPRGSELGELSGHVRLRGEFVTLRGTCGGCGCNCGCVNTGHPRCGC